MAHRHGPFQLRSARWLSAQDSAALSQALTHLHPPAADGASDTEQQQHQPPPDFTPAAGSLEQPPPPPSSPSFHSRGTYCCLPSEEQLRLRALLLGQGLEGHVRADSLPRQQPLPVLSATSDADQDLPALRPLRWSHPGSTAGDAARLAAMPSTSTAAGSASGAEAGPSQRAHSVESVPAEGSSHLDATNSLTSQLTSQLINSNLAALSSSAGVAGTAVRRPSLHGTDSSHLPLLGSPAGPRDQPRPLPHDSGSPAHSAQRTGGKGVASSCALSSAAESQDVLLRFRQPRLEAEFLGWVVQRRLLRMQDIWVQVQHIFFCMWALCRYATARSAILT